MNDINLLKKSHLQRSDFGFFKDFVSNIGEPPDESIRVIVLLLLLVP